MNNKFNEFDLDHNGVLTQNEIKLCPDLYNADINGDGIVDYQEFKNYFGQK